MEGAFKEAGDKTQRYKGESGIMENEELNGTRDGKNIWNGY